MQINNFINLKRFWLLLKRDMYTQYKTYLTGLGAIFCILFIVNISSIASYNSWNFNLVFYPLTLFIGGFIFTSMIFSELSPEQNRIFYLTIPASGLEKLLSKLIITNIGYVIGSLVLYFLFSVIAFFFNTLIFGFAHRIFNPFHPVIWLCIRIYLVTQSIFLLGAVYFKRNVFLKTILYLFGFAVAYAVFVFGIFFIMYSIMSFNSHIYFSLEFFMSFGQGGFSQSSVVSVISIILLYISRILFWFVLSPLLWIILYFRLKEIEV